VDLSRLEWVCRAAGAEAVLPGTSAERTVAAIWRDVLEIDIICVDANFFSVGGQSILLLQVLAKLEQSFGREIAVVDLFRYPTVRSLAAFLGEAAPEKRSFDAAADRARRQRAARRPRRRPRGLR
jgi:acyl carrier protein